MWRIKIVAHSQHGRGCFLPFLYFLNFLHFLNFLPSFTFPTSLNSISVEGTTDEVASYDKPLNLARPFAHAPDANFTIPPLQRQIFGYAVGAVNLHRPVNDTS